jgi:hypothetical protein
VVLVGTDVSQPYGPSGTVEGITLTIHLYLQLYRYLGQPQWSSGQSSWLKIQRSRVLFAALRDTSGPGTRSTKPRDDK